jgi:cold shock CspA family protein
MSSTPTNTASPNETNTATAQPQSDRVTGQVKWFNTKAGYGFITGCNGAYSNQDIFVHYSSIKVANSQYRYLVQGEYVEFDIVKPEGDKHEHHAINVSGLNNGPIMCEARRSAVLSRGGNDSRPRPVGRRLRMDRRDYENRDGERDRDGEREQRDRQEKRPRQSSSNANAGDEGFTYVRKRRDERPDQGRDRDRERGDDRRSSRGGNGSSNGRSERPRTSRRD